MFSVIIPLYNKAEYIENSIHSVLRQTYADFEIIIVNDGSRDNSLEIIQGIRDPRIRILDQENAGVSTARNNGVASANYDHIAFLDADDWWDKEFLSEMKRLIENYPEAALYGCRYWYVKNKHNRLTNVGLPDNFNEGYIDYFKTFSNTFVVPLNCSFAIVRKQIFDNIGGFASKLKFGEDFDLWSRIALKYKVAYCNTPLAYSNQDVNPQDRALGQKKYWKADEHFAFNLDHLFVLKDKNPIISVLLDGILVRVLSSFYLSGFHKEKTRLLLKTIDFKKQPFYYRFFYRSPLFVVKLFIKMKYLGSRIKQHAVNNVKT